MLHLLGAVLSPYFYFFLYKPTCAFSTTKEEIYERSVSVLKMADPNFGHLYESLAFFPHR